MVAGVDHALNTPMRLEGRRMASEEFDPEEQIRENGRVLWPGDDYIYEDRVESLDDQNVTARPVLRWFRGRGKLESLDVLTEPPLTFPRSYLEKPLLERIREHRSDFFFLYRPLLGMSEETSALDEAN
jgi:hypothetical protein